MADLGKEKLIMADEGAHKTPDNVRGNAVTMLAKKLQEMGVNRDAALLAAQDARKRIYTCPDPKAPILIQKMGGGLGELYQPSFSDPIGALATDMFKMIPDSEKLVATRRQQEERDALMAEKAQSGDYKVL
jgi:hypothetical protein